MVLGVLSLTMGNVLPNTLGYPLLISSTSVGWVRVIWLTLLQENPFQNIFLVNWNLITYIIWKNVLFYQNFFLLFWHVLDNYLRADKVHEATLSTANPASSIFFSLNSEEGRISTIETSLRLEMPVQRKELSLFFWPF